MSDDEGFGDLFGGEEAVPEYPLQTLAIDRLALADEGLTYEYFDPLLDRFDNIAPADATTAAVEGQIAVLRQRLAALAPPPLEVKYRDKRHSLWGHKLWNAAKYIVKRMDERLIDVRGKAVIELGAGLGVPTLAAFKNGARLSVVTDYPDAELLDIIAMNVEANCAPGDVDADVKAEMESVARAQLSADGREPTPEQLQVAVSTRCIVEPLLWGKKEHIDKVMAYTTGGAGYDIVILSDILFNHVCNDDLADTLAALLAKNPHAAGYCVFSHHRAFKQLHDFEFFDKCVRRGLHYEQLDEQNYPMMFPEDRGPEEVRQPVKCYKITRRYDDAGFGLDASLRFDVVLQGTGMVQSILSAALARSGLKVLHCDGEDHYAGPMATFDDEGLVRHLETLKQLTSSKDGSGSRGQLLPPSSLSLPSPQVVVNRMAEEVPAARRRRYLFDLLPLLYLARGPLLRKLAAAGLTGSLECQHVARFLFLSHGGATSSGEAATAAAAAAAAMEVPLTRATVFGNTTVSLFDKRRLMRFVKDVEASLAEQLHAKTANPADDPSVANTSAAAADAEAAAAAIFAQAAAADPSVTLRGLLEKKYALTGTALEVASLMGMMDVLPRPSTSTMTDDAPRAGAGEPDGATGIAAQPPLMQSVDMERDVLLSTGAYNGKSPFLTTSYGAAEVPQCMCRTSAVWGGVFVLRRSLRGVAVDEEKETQFAVLSNGQWVPAKVIVTPAELAASYLTYGVQDWYYDVLHEHEMGRTPLIPLEAAGASASSSLIMGAQSAAVDDDESAAAAASTAEDRVQLSRVVLATKTTPLFSWEALRAAQAVEVDEERDYTAAAPVLTALVREPTTQAVVWIVQQSFACDQAPPREMAAAAAQADQEGKEDAAHPVPPSAVAADPCVVHFTADAHELSQEQLYAYVQRFYVTGPKDVAAAAPAATGSYSVPQDDIIFAAAFTLDSVAVAQCGVVADPVELPSETRWTHLFGWEESTKLRHANEHDRQHLLRQRASSSAAAAEAEEKEKTTTEDGEGRERARPASPVTSAARAKKMCQASEHFRVVQVPSLLPNFVYDGHYMQAAEAAYQRTLGLLGLHAEGEAENTYGFLQPKPAE